MNLYVTYGDKERLRKAFLNLRKQLIIDTNEVVRSLGYLSEDLTDYSYFIINEKIKKQIKTVSAGTRMQSIIYINPNINYESIKGLINFAELETSIEKVIFLTDKGKNEELYELFHEIVYYPTAKKVHIIKCQPINFINDEFE
ncbi:MAG: hypothetical protein RLZZ479_697 [Bacteroidota bacterium]|jgi:hypothetical protein